MTQHFFVKLLWRAARSSLGLPRVAAAIFLLNRSDIQLNWMERAELNQAIKEGRLHFMARMYGLRR